MERSTDHRVSVFEESVRVVSELLAGRTVSSERFGFDDVALGLVPEHGVEWWMGTGNPAGLRRAARHGAAWYAGPGIVVDDFVVADAAYREACADHGTAPRVMLRRDVLVLREGDRAREVAARAVASGYRGMRLDQLVVGSPAEVADQLTVWARLGVEQVVTRPMGLGDDLDLETIECLGEVGGLLAG